MKSDKNSTNYKKESSAYIKNFNNASWLEELRFKTKGLFSGDPKLTVRVDRKKHKIKIVLFDNHFKLMFVLALFFIICWGYCIFKTIVASEENDILKFGIISLIAFFFATMIIRRAIQYEKEIFAYIDNLVRHGDATNKLFNGMLSGSSKDINNALQKIDKENMQVVSDFKKKNTSEK